MMGNSDCGPFRGITTKFRVDEASYSQLFLFFRLNTCCTFICIVGSDRMLVFVETKRMADFLASYLSQTGFPTTSIHGLVNR